MAASLYAADWTGSSSVPKNTKNIDGKAFYVITSAEELTWFAEQVNGGASEINAILANDIHFMDDTSEISTLSWTPIGKDSLTMFNGIFDGAGRTICGLYSEQLYFSGIFGVAGEKAIIKNVKAAKTSVFGGYYVGGIVAFNKGRVELCENVADLGHSSDYSGGIVGWNKGIVIGCTNRGLVSRYPGGSSAGGIAGWNMGTVSGCTNSGTVSVGNLYRGGIVGRNGGVVSGCTNSGSVSGSKSGGGIVGWNEETGIVSVCANSGTVSGGESGGIVGENEGSVSDCTNSGSISSGEPGGVVGWNEETGIVSVCTNSGTVSGSKSGGGGIVGWNKGMVMDCRNLGRSLGGGGLVGLDLSADSNAIMLNSFSVADSASAGIILGSYSNTVTNCYYDSDILMGKSTIAPNLGWHTSDMQSDRFAWVLNTTNGDSAHSGVWSRNSVGYPIFADSLHKPIYKVVFYDSGATSNRFTNYKGLISFPENPEPLEGKLFFGWYADNGVKVNETTIFSKDQTVYAFYCEPSSCPPEPSDALVANLPTPTWSVTAAGRNFQIHAAPVGKSYALFDLQGKVLAKGRIESSEMTISAPRAGSYIVRIGNHSVRVNAK